MLSEFRRCWTMSDAPRALSAKAGRNWPPRPIICNRSSMLWWSTLLLNRPSGLSSRPTGRFSETIWSSGDWESYLLKFYWRRLYTQTHVLLSLTHIRACESKHMLLDVVSLRFLNFRSGYCSKKIARSWVRIITRHASFSHFGSELVLDINESFWRTRYLARSQFWVYL